MNRLFHELQTHAFPRHDANRALERSFDRNNERLADTDAVFDAIATILELLDDACPGAIAGRGAHAYRLGANEDEHVIRRAEPAPHVDATVEGLDRDLACGARHDASRQSVDLTDEVGNKETCRVRVDLLRRADL